MFKEGERGKRKEEKNVLLFFAYPNCIGVKAIKN
jgi:hypothetical protein